MQFLISTETLKVWSENKDWKEKQIQMLKRNLSNYRLQKSFCLRDKNRKLLSHTFTPRKCQVLVGFNLPKRRSKGRPYIPSLQLPICLQDHTTNYLNEKVRVIRHITSFKLSWKSTENSFHWVIKVSFKTSSKIWPQGIKKIYICRRKFQRKFIKGSFAIRQMHCTCLQVKYLK